MGKLTDRLFRRTIELILIAGRHGEEGYLPPLDAIAWVLRCDQEQLETEMFNLAQYGILSQTDGRWTVTNYAKRQAPIDGNIRTQEWRKRKLKTQMSQDGDGVVTKRPVDTDTDTDTDTDETSPEALLLSRFCEVTGIVPNGSEKMAEKWHATLIGWVKKNVTPDMITKAVEIAAGKYTITGPWSLNTNMANLIIKNDNAPSTPYREATVKDMI